MDPTDAGADQSSQVIPPGWTKGFSRSQNRHYYCYPEEKHTQWEFPTAADIADPAKAKQRTLQKQKREQKERARNQSSSSSSQKRLAEATNDTSENDPKRSRSTANTSTKTDNGKSINTPVVRNATKEKPSIAIIVPYRDIHPKQNRSKHLQKFIPEMQIFLNKLQHKRKLIQDYHIYIVEQSDDGRKFNRGKLLNIGFDIATKDRISVSCRTRKVSTHSSSSPSSKEATATTDSSQTSTNNTPPIVYRHNVFIFHDVDLLPGDDLAKSYATYPHKPIHIARVWDRYSNNAKYFGGIVSFSDEDMKRINGYPNTFWGWGGEDDEMQNRCEKLKIKWEYPHTGTITDLEQMDLQTKLAFLKSNKSWKCMVKWEALGEHETTWKKNGLKDLDYKILSVQSLPLPPSSSGSGFGEYAMATKLTVDVKLNANHWANDKCGMDYMPY